MESEEGQGSTFFFSVKLQAQANSKTYSQEFNLKDICQKCPHPFVIADKESVRIEWDSLLKNMGISSVTSMTILDAEKYLKKTSKELISILIIDTDFDLVNDVDNGNSSTTTSQSILTRIQKNYDWIQQIPTLCIIDSRTIRSRKRVSEELEANFSSSVIQHPQGSIEPLPTPHEEKVNPLETSIPSAKAKESNVLHLNITKPFKNSALIDILHELLSNGERPSTPRKQRLGSVGSVGTHGRLSRKTTDKSQKSGHVCEKSIDDLGLIKTLVVDDNPVNLKVLSRMLTQIGISSTQANNGREAYELVLKASKTEEPFQLIFMDIWMPELNGLEASEKIRKEAASSTTLPYIIALTACVMPGDRDKCIEAGMNGYVSKPIRKEELEASIHTFTQTVSNPEL